MAWTSPPSYSELEFVDEDDFNLLRDNFAWLKDRVYNQTVIAATSTTSTSFVKMTGSDCAITTVGGDVAIAFIGTVWHSATGATSFFDLAIDGTRVGDATTGLSAIITTNINYNYTLMLWHQTNTPPASGSRTASLYWKTDTGTQNGRGWLWFFELR